MNEQQNDKREASERLFSALSGVDEKYLAACQADVGGKKTGGIVLFMNRYGKTMAAVLCLALLGLGYYSVQHGGSLSGDNAAADCAPMNFAEEKVSYSPQLPMIKDEEMAEEGVAEQEEADKELCAEPASGKTESAITNREDSKTGVSDKLLEFGGTVLDPLEEVDEEQRKSYQTASAEYIAQAQAMPVIGAYVPVNWPDKGAVMQLISDGPTLDNPVYTAWLFWSYDYLNDGFCVQVNGCGEKSDWMEEEVVKGNVVYAADYSQDYVSSRLKPVHGDAAGLSVEDGELVEGSFGVLYEEDGQFILVRFHGVGTMEQIREMMQ